MVMVMMLRWWWGRLLLQLILLNLNAKLRGKVLFSWLRGGDGRVDQGGSSGGGRVGGVGDIVVVSASSSLLEGIEVGHVYASGRSLGGVNRVAILVFRVGVVQAWPLVTEV